MLLSSRRSHTGLSEHPLQLLPQVPRERGPVLPHSKCLRRTLSTQEMGQFLGINFIFKTKFELGYCSFLFDEYRTASPQDWQTLCFRIPLPSCAHQPMTQMKTGLLSPISAAEAKAHDSFKVLQVTMGILSATWLASLILRHSSLSMSTKYKRAEPNTLGTVCRQSRKEGDFPLPSEMLK